MALLCYLHCAILRDLIDFKLTEAHETRDSEFLLQNVQNY